jgi:hypothetical protein
MNIQRKLAISLRSMGEVTAERGEFREARDYLSDARDRLEALVSRFPADIELQVNLLMTSLELARTAKALGDQPELEAHKAAAVRLLEQIEQAQVPQELAGSLREKLKKFWEP